MDGDEVVAKVDGTEEKPVGSTALLDALHYEVEWRALLMTEPIVRATYEASIHKGASQTEWLEFLALSAVQMLQETRAAHMRLLERVGV